MAAPHVAGAAALAERHQNWSPRTVKSALVSAAGPAWADTARTRWRRFCSRGAASSTSRRPTPFVVTDPVSLSFGDLNVRGGARRVGRLLAISDADGGAGRGRCRFSLRP